jgi:hypothetical protein
MAAEISPKRDHRAGIKTQVGGPGLGRIAVSAIEVPISLVNLV